LGKKIDVSRPISLANDSAHESGPAQPPDMIIESWGSDDMSPWTTLDADDFLDPTIPILMIQPTTIEDNQKSSHNHIRHKKRSFFGCFVCRLKKNIDYNSFKQWKISINDEKTNEIADVICEYITNYYDFITTAPPSKNRDLNRYCCFELCKVISSKTGIPFVISFQQRKAKYGHGRFASLSSEMPELIIGWSYTGKAILFIDDFITSGMTAKTCYEVLRAHNNHIDGLIYCEY